jgi:hypothetical protein
VESGFAPPPVPPRSTVTAVEPLGSVADALTRPTLLTETDAAARTLGFPPESETLTAAVTVTGGLLEAVLGPALVDTVTFVASTIGVTWPAAAVLVYPRAASETNPTQAANRGADMICTWVMRTL